MASQAEWDEAEPIASSEWEEAAPEEPGGDSWHERLAGQISGFFGDSLVGHPTRLAQKVNEGAIPGSNKIAAAIDATIAPLVPSGASETVFGDPQFADMAGWLNRYAQREDQLRGVSADTTARFPVLAPMATLGGAALAAPFVPAGLNAPTAASRTMQAARVGGGAGATYALGDSQADSIGGAVGDAGRGALLGGLMGGAFQGAGELTSVPRALPSAAGAPDAPPALGSVEERPLRQFVEAKMAPPIPEAEWLRSQGVNLTAGQMRPRSILGTLEEASTSLRGVGPLLKARRDVPVRQWQELSMRQALPPGASLKASGELADDLGAIYEAFGPAYGAIKEMEVFPAIHANGKGMPLQTLGKSTGAFDVAIADRTIGATASTRMEAKQFLDAQLSLLPPRKGAVGRVKVDDLLNLRSNIRHEIRNARSGNPSREDRAYATLLENAEEAVTESIASQVPESVAGTLKAIDTKYRNYAIIEDAISRAGDSPSGFTPSQLTQAIKAASDRRRFAQDSGIAWGDVSPEVLGDELRPYSRAGRRVFESQTPPTGARILATGALGEYLTGPAVAALNRGRPVAPAQIPGAPPNAGAFLEFLGLPPESMTPEVIALLRMLPQGRTPVGLPAAVGEEEP